MNMSVFFHEYVGKFPRNFSLVNFSEYPSPVKQNIRGVNMEKFLGIFPSICRNFPENRLEFFHEYVGKFPRNFS
jgi:hypothetical protein